MPQISTQEFERLPLRVHDLLAGVPLHDVWATDLRRPRSGITLDEFSRAANSRPFTPSPVVRTLLGVRLFVSRILGWDREPDANAWETFATRLTTTDSSKSIVLAGRREGFFRVVYRFENEQLLEVVNRTVHGAALSALVETAEAYRFYFAVYVRSVSHFTPVYMALVDPFRKLVVKSVNFAFRLRNLESSLLHRLSAQMPHRREGGDQACSLRIHGKGEDR